MPAIHHSVGALLLALTASTVCGSPAPQQSAGAPPAQQMTDDDLASWVLDANPGLAALRAAAEAAAFRIDPAGSLDDPMLSYGVAPLTAGADRSLNQKFDISQKIPWPGTLAAREDAARYDALVAERDVDALRLQVVARAKSAHAEWQFIAAAMDTHHDTRSLLDELIATAGSRYAAGRALKQDVLQAELERANLDNHLLRLVRQRTAIQAGINALLNRDPDAPLPAASPELLLPPPPVLETLQTLALARHPELSRLNASISASESRITLAEKAFYPDFQVGVGYNSLWDPVDKRPVLGLSINIPWDRSKRRSDLDRARAEKRRTSFSLSNRRAELLAALATARAEVIEARNTVRLFEDKLVPLAAEYLEAAIADYQSGAGAFVNVITAEQRKLATDLDLARARADYVKGMAELELWTGGPPEASSPTAAGATE
ncbi:MAG: TolC family protein [Woeseia sp.]